jgi:hypothetical protein
VTEALIRHLSDVQLRDVMAELLRAEAYRCGADLSKVLVNAELKASDDGADATTPPGVTSHQWLGDVETCWQLKAGAAGQPSKLNGEVTKPIAAQTLRAGGRFVLVASGAVDGKHGVEARRLPLVRDAKRARLPTRRIDVITCEALTTWINEHPAIAAGLRDMPAGFMLLRDWARSPTYKDPWVSSAALDAKLAKVRQAIAFDNPSPTIHLHVFGRPGIGKSRFVLQACQEAPWTQSVLYVPQWADANIAGLLASLAQAGAGRLVLVVDEVPPDRVRWAVSQASTAPERIRLITIGHHESPDSGEISQLEVDALDDETMARLVKAAHSELPDQHVRYVVRFADGYTRLARLAADAVDKNADLQTADLLQHGDIRQLMDSMLGGGDDNDRRPLHVLAILTSVGWTGARAVEGEAIAEHFHLDWSAVRASVEQFHRRFGIAPRANDLRYISPAPLGVYLALEAVQSYPDLISTLRDKLPTAQAKRAYDERLAAILANPHARAFGEEELARFFHWRHFLDASAVDRWGTLSLANPALAASKAHEALRNATDEERRQIDNGARRGLVRGLVRLAAYCDAFHDAAWALAELAAAENETWANNASREFVARFQLRLSGTASPYRERLAVLDELLATGRSQLQSLAVSALARAGARYEGGRVDDATTPGPTPVTWLPATRQERLDSMLAAFRLLNHAATLAVPHAALADAAKPLAIWLRDAPVREAVAAFYRTAASAHPSIRESLRREVHRIADLTVRVWKDRDEADIAWIEELAHELSDTTTRGQLREIAGPPGHEWTENGMQALAQQLVAEPEIFWAEWPWLTGGEAAGAWHLGAALERADTKRELLPRLLSAVGTGTDLRIVAGYVSARARSMPDGWIDDWLDELEESRAADPSLVFDLTSRLTATSRGAQRLTRMARANRLPQSAVAHLTFSPWVLGPDVSTLRELIEILITTPDHRLNLLHMLGNRLQDHPTDLAALEALALQLVCDPRVLVSDSMSQYHWDELARVLAPRYGRMIASTIFAAQARLDGASFFLEESAASSTLDACISADPHGVWAELMQHLSNDDRSGRFSVGFPNHVMEAMPRHAVLEWIADAPKHRAPLVASITAKNFADSSLAAAILDRWGAAERVKQHFFSAFITGGWSGHASAHWEHLATQLDGVAKQTKLLGIKRWALASAMELRRMAASDRKREEEQRIRGYG